MQNTQQIIFFWPQHVADLTLSCVRLRIIKHPPMEKTYQWLWDIYSILWMCLDKWHVRLIWTNLPCWQTPYGTHESSQRAAGRHVCGLLLFRHYHVLYHCRLSVHYKGPGACRVQYSCSLTAHARQKTPLFFCSESARKKKHSGQLWIWDYMSLSWWLEILLNARRFSGTETKPAGGEVCTGSGTSLGLGGTLSRIK